MKNPFSFLCYLAVIVISGCSLFSNDECYDIARPLEPEEKALVPYKVGDTAWFTSNQDTNLYYLTCISYNDTTIEEVRDDKWCKDDIDITLNNLITWDLISNIDIYEEKDIEIHIALTANALTYSFEFHNGTSSVLKYHTYKNEQIDIFSWVKYFHSTKKYINTDNETLKDSLYYLSETAYYFFDTLIYSNHNGFIEFNDQKRNLTYTKRSDQ